MCTSVIELMKKIIIKCCWIQNVNVRDSIMQMILQIWIVNLVYFNIFNDLMYVRVRNLFNFIGKTRVSNSRSKRYMTIFGS